MATSVFDLEIFPSALGPYVFRKTTEQPLVFSQTTAVHCESEWASKCASIIINSSKVNPNVALHVPKKKLVRHSALVQSAPQATLRQLIHWSPWRGWTPGFGSWVGSWLQPLRPFWLTIGQVTRRNDGWWTWMTPFFFLNITYSKKLWMFSLGIHDFLGTFRQAKCRQQMTGDPRMVSDG